MIRIIDATALSLMATGALAQATINFDATQSAVFKDEAGTMCTKLRMKATAPLFRLLRVGRAHSKRDVIAICDFL
jgi:hypothetical protein